MKKTILTTIICFCCTLLFAQEIFVQSNEKGMFLKHTVAAKENFFSIGRLYNIPAKDISAFNGIDMTSGLSVGQTINIPLNQTNFTQEKENGRPIYYLVGQKEGLYRVSVNNNKVPMANLRKWNSLANDNISTGQKLVVGYLISPEANNIAGTAKPEAPVVTEQVKVSSPEKVKDVAKTEEKTATPKQEVEKKQDNSFKTVSHTSSDANSTGYFKSQFDLQTKVQPLQNDQLVNAGIFKTASGWQDAKYYALMDNVEPGTIIKIVNSENNKSVYAKVLDKMAGIRQNQGYDLRLSNAAATALDISDTDKFFVRVVY